MTNEGPFTLTIPNAGTDSGLMSALLSTGQVKILNGSGRRLSVTSPATLTGTITIQVVPIEGSSTWTTLQVNGTDVTIAAGKTNLFPMSSWRDMRMHSSGAEGGARDFILNFEVEVT